MDVKLGAPKLSAPSLRRGGSVQWRPQAGGARRGGSRGSGSRAAVGLDVQPGYVAAVQARANGSLAVARAAGRALPPETVREGEILDETLLTQALRELFDDSKLPRRVRLGVANQRTVLRVIELPPIDDRKALEAAVRFQAQDHMPMPLANAVLDFQPLGIVETPAGPRQRVVVVAAQRDMVSRLLSAVEAAGLRPVGVDLSAFAMIRALHRAGDGGGAASSEEGVQPDASASTLYLNVGGLTNLAIAEGLACRFTRMVSGGLESMASELAERHSIALTDARELLGTVDFGVASAPPVQAAAPVEPDATESAVSPVESKTTESATAPDHDEAHEGHSEQDVAREAGVVKPAGVESAADLAAATEAKTVLQAGVREIAGEVRNSLDFHRSQGGGEVREVVLSGAALEIAGFAAALEAELGFPLVRRSVEIDGGERPGGVSAERLAIAAGLAVEEVAA